MIETHHKALQQAKADLDAAVAYQDSSRKQVIDLLERKHSWSASDLERYLGLIRSEHGNNQAIQDARDRQVAAERALEHARLELIKKEREVYRGETAWHSVVMRNSTWFSVGLMGLNLLVLIASMVLLEPWRRRRMVREIKSAMQDSQNAPLVAAAAASIRASDEPPLVTASAEKMDTVESAIDASVEPAGVPLEIIEQATEHEALRTTTAADDFVSGAFTAASPRDILHELKAISAEASQAAKALNEVADQANEATAPPFVDDGTWTAWAERQKRAARKLFSDQMVTVKKVDVTTVALQGAAAGAAFAGILVVLFRPR